MTETKILDDTVESADNNDLKYLMDNIISEWF